MTTFIVCLAILFFGYSIWGRVTEKAFGADPKRPTPVKTMADGVDYIPLPTWRIFLIQFLNIAGTGPIFGAIMGALFGPAAYIWIVVGCLFAGSVHDYLSGMISVRTKGASLTEIVGQEFGPVMKIVMLVFSMILLILVGTVFTTTSAGLLDQLVPDHGFLWSKTFFLILIFIYFITATILPIDTVIARFYPVFGAALIVMTIGILLGIFGNDGYVPEISEITTWRHPKGLPIYPIVCMTIACGALSGFHSTQSPLMARCLKNESKGRAVFFGAMIVEGMIALIWATAAIKFTGSGEGLMNALKDPATGASNPAALVNFICQTWMGRVGAILSVLGVVAAPITSGDTAFRSTRLILADFFHVDSSMKNRILLALPLFAISCALLFINFDILWRYFALSNQILATISLLTFTVWLYRRNRPWLLTAIPAFVMTYTCFCYILVAPECFHLAADVSYIGAAVPTLIVLAAMIIFLKRIKRQS